MAEAEFVVVRGKRSRKRKTPTSKSDQWSQEEDKRIIEDKKYIEDRLRQCRKELELDPLMQQIKELLPSALSKLHTTGSQTNHTPRGDTTPTDVHLIGYGIGPFASRLVAKYHLACFLLLKELLQVAESNCCVYDPIFCDEEKEIIQKSGCTLLETNEEGKRAVSKPSVFFMPHCGKALYNNLLWANWSPDRLQNLVIIGNSFEEIVLNCSTTVLKKDYAYINKIYDYTTLVPMETRDLPEEVFSSTVLHTFPPEQLAKVPSRSWASNPEPVYSDDVEIIQNKKS